MGSYSCDKPATVLVRMAGTDSKFWYCCDTHAQRDIDQYWPKSGYVTESLSNWYEEEGHKYASLDRH